MWRNTFLNVKQRERFIALTFAKNSEDSLNRLVRLELRRDGYVSCK